MKNKIIKFIYAIIFAFSFAAILYSDELDIKTTEINILQNGKLLTGSKGFNIITDKNVEISGEKFSFNKELQELNAEGNINIIDRLNEIKINSEIIEYKKKEEKFLIKNKAIIKYQNNYTLYGEDIIYSKNNSKIFSEKKIKIIDSRNNTLLMDNFEIDQLKNILSGNNAIFEDNISNSYSIEKFKFNLSNKEIVGKDFYINIGDNKIEKDIYRFKGRSIIDNANETIISKGVFTTCKKRDGCPPWRIEAENITHDKKKKLMNYKNAWLKIYDVPIFYFPKFFHPDPSVERQSGFLFPTFADSKNLGASLKIPYFKAISESKDLTFSPRLFEANKAILQTEYRQANKNSFHIADLSFFNHEENSRSHLFYNSKYDIESKNFDKTFLEINLQRTNNDTYLNTYNISSPIIKSKTILDSSIDYRIYDEKFSLNIYTKAIEDMSKKGNDRFEYVYPYVDFSKSFNNLSYSLNGYNKKFNTNQDLLDITNKIIYSPNEKYFASGLKSDWSLIFKNTNIKVDKADEKQRNDLKGGFHYNVSLPMINRSEKFYGILDPKVSFRYSPNKNQNSSSDEKRLDYNSVFDLERIKTVEGGSSATIGFDYKLTDNINNNEFFKIGLSQVFRDQENKDLPDSSSIGDKASDIFGNIALINKDFIELDYIFNLSDGLSDSSYESIDLDVNINRFVTSFEYLDDEISSDGNNYFTSSIKYNHNDNHSITFAKRDNKTTNITEYNDLIYEYRNDCLKASVEYKKHNYTNNDLKPEEELMFTLTIGTFGTISSPKY